MEVLIVKSTINTGFSSKPCLTPEFGTLSARASKAVSKRAEHCVPRRNWAVAVPWLNRKGRKLSQFSNKIGFQQKEMGVLWMN